MYTIEDIRAAWLESMVDLWAENIHDPRDSERIKTLFRAVGWGFWVDDADGYKDDAKHAWCGIGQAAAAMRVGEYLEPDRCVSIYLDPDVAKYAMPSTQRLASMRRWTQAGADMPTTLAKTADIARFAAPGILGTVGHRLIQGTHIVLIEKVRDDGKIETIECNGHGERADGSWGDGVVRRYGKKARDVSDFARLILLDESHFEDNTAEVA